MNETTEGVPENRYCMKCFLARQVHQKMLVKRQLTAGASVETFYECPVCGTTLRVIRSGAGILVDYFIGAPPAPDLKEKPATAILLAEMDKHFAFIQELKGEGQ